MSGLIGLLMVGNSKQQASSAPEPQNVAGCKADDVCVVGGGDAVDVCVVGDVVGGESDAACVVDDDSFASGKTEILTGSEALRFLYANCRTAEHARSRKSQSWTKLFLKMLTRETTASSFEPTSPALAASRKHRKVHRPSRVPPLEEDEPLPPKKKDPVVPDTLVSHDFRKGKKNGISDSGAIKDNHGASLTANGKQSMQQSLSTQQNAAIVCKNLACKAILPAEASFCRRCSCCICMEFDDNKDPSLWITCDREEEGCGLSCHVECALQNQVAGVIKKHGSVWLDGSFACKSCGKISSLIGLWRRQLSVAKAARRVDVLCHRLTLSQRLLDGTMKYKEAHTLVDNAVKKLDAEVSLMKKGSAKLERCIVKRLSCDLEVQEMIDLALEQAESLGDAQSVVLDTLDAVDNDAPDDTLGYKLWHRKATDAKYPAAPTCTIQNSCNKVLVSDLQSCTSYVFKMTPFSSQGEREECEAECCTEGIDSTLVEHCENDAFTDCVLEDINTNHGATNVGSNPQHHSSVEFEFKQIGTPERFGGLVDDLSSAKDEVGGDFCMKDLGDARTGHPFVMQRVVMDSICDDVTSSGELEKQRKELFVSRDVVDNSPLSMANNANADVTDNGIPNSQSWAMQLRCYEAQKATVSKAYEIDRKHGFSHGSCNTGFNIEEFSIKVVRWLECQGHLDKEFRMKFLTWYGLRATEHEKRAVSIFIDTLRDSPASLAAQLVDAFQEIINSKRQQRAAELGYYSRPYQ